MSVQQEAFRVAVTGGTGFVGRTTIAQACALGLPLNALARQPQAACAGVTWVNGALDRDDCLQRLMADADVVLQIAGVVNAPAKAGFHTGNIAGTLAAVREAGVAGVRGFVTSTELSTSDGRRGGAK